MNAPSIAAKPNRQGTVDVPHAASVDRRHVLNIWSLRQACPTTSLHVISDDMATTDVLRNDVNVNFNARYLKQVHDHLF